MKIPRAFVLMGCRYVVKVIPQEEWKEADAVGLFYSYPKEIHILKGTPDAMAHAFYHELAHAILTAMGKKKLNDDEGFVDLLSGLLHQAHVSAEY